MSGTFLRQRIEQLQKLLFANLYRLRDIRFVGQVVFVLIVLLVSWSGVKAINTNYALEKQVATMQERNNLQELENTNLQLQNTYYNSDQYLELSARQNFGLGLPGEKEVIVPKSVAMSYLVPEPASSDTKPTTNPPSFIQNIRAWLDFFMHRTS